MSKVWVIAIREFRSTFTTAVGWVVLCAWLFVVGEMWFRMVTTYVRQSQDLVFDPYAGMHLTLSEHLLAPFFGNVAVLVVMVVPAITMRTIARERSQHTLELLLSSPLRSSEIVLGKFIGAGGFLALLVGLTAPYPLALLWWGSPDLGVIASSYLALGLLGAALLALGLLCSSATENQLVAFVLAFAAGLAMLFADDGGNDPYGSLTQLSFVSHLQELLQGAVRLSDLAYFVAGTALLLFATHQRLESFRWS